MIKNFETYINEDYFSKLANRKDNGGVRKENEITEDIVRSFIRPGYEYKIKSISFRKENGKTIVDIYGDCVLRYDIEEIPFQFGTVIGIFSVDVCSELTSLEGCPEIVYGNFYCSYCKKLSSLEGCPKEVEGDFACHYCGKKFTKEEVKTLCYVGGDIYD